MIDKFRDEIDKQLAEAMSAATNRAINVRARPATQVPQPDGRSVVVMPASTAEEIALSVVDALAEARAYGRAQQILAATFKKFVAPEPEADPKDKPENKGRMYG